MDSQNAPAGRLAAIFPSMTPHRRAQVLRKNFPFLALLRDTSPSLSADPTLAGISARRADVAALDWPACAEAMLFSPDEIDRGADALSTAATKAALLPSIAAQLRRSMAYQQYHHFDDAGFIAAAWRDAADGINGIIGAYALGAEQSYPGIDSPSYDLASAAFQAMAKTALAAIAAEAAGALFFMPSLDFALDLLGIHRRDEAGRFEPLAEGHNKAALAQLAAVEWSDFPYVALIVHGVGDGKPGAAMSAATTANCATVAAKFRHGLAPVIVPTGGACHPKQTPFHEAIEIKRTLMFAHGIPEHAILVDPHARHTTTNLRNPARLLAEAGAPWGKPSVSVSVPQQINLIMSRDFTQFCVAMLGYAPMTLGRRLDANSVEVTLTSQSLMVDLSDPLDP